jgi:flagellar assembly protein FliH
VKRYVPYRFPALASVSSAASSQGALGRESQSQSADAFDFALPESPLQAHKAYDDAQEAREASTLGYEEGFAHGEIEGHNTGFARGHEEGLRQGTDEAKGAALIQFEGVASTVDGLVAALKQLQSEFASALHTDLIDLVEKVAHQVVRSELTLRPEQLLALVDEAVATLHAATDAIEIYLPRETCERIAALSDERAKSWNLIADARLALGECRIKAGGREIDAGCKQRLDTCMEQVREQLLPVPQTQSAAAQGSAQ